MQRSYGAAGDGAIVKIIDDVYLLENPPPPAFEGVGPASAGCGGCLVFLFKFVVGYLAVAGVLGGLVYMTEGSIAAPFVLALSVGVLVLLLRKPMRRLMNRSTSRPESDQQGQGPANGPGRSREAIAAEMNHAFLQMRSGVPVGQTAIPEDKCTWAIGALTEVRVAMLLDQRLPASDVVANDLGIVDARGNEYNIDHVVLTRVGMVQVDSKNWGKTPAFIPSPSPYEDGVMVQPGGHQASAVRTCVFEASHLPVWPIALVFAVDGRAEAGLPPGGVQVTHYSDTDGYKGPPVTRRVPFPVVFCKASEVAEIVTGLVAPSVSALAPGMTGPGYVSLGQLLSAPNIYINDPSIRTR